MNIQIISFNKLYANDFKLLNFEWLEKYFHIEDYDRIVLENPQKYILDIGGDIYLAKCEDQIVGTIALMKREANMYEIAKMAVTKKYKGHKIGLRLLYWSIQKAIEKGASRVFLDTNSKLKPALHLYEKIGFKNIPAPKDSPYCRCNTRMEIVLK